jgi:hypothetical protein
VEGGGNRDSVARWEGDGEGEGEEEEEGEGEETPCPVAVIRGAIC